MKKYTLLGVTFERFDVREARRLILRMLDGNRPSCVFTPNAQILDKTARDRRLVALLNSADLLLPDGVGISLACRLSGIRGVRRITGIDTAEWLLRVAERRGLSVFLIGGKKGIASLAAKRLKQKLPRLNVCGTHHGYFDKSSHSAENKALIRKLRKARPDVVFVCMGFPLQEAWISSNAPSLPSVRIFMGLGGSLDVWSGSVRRAPKPIRLLCLEWLWRCTITPKKLPTLLPLPHFLISSIKS